MFFFSSAQPPGGDADRKNPGAPFAVHYSSQSPVLGCLLAVGVLVVGGLLAVGAGIAVIVVPVGLLVWRLVKAFLPGPPVDEFAQPQAHTTPGIIDVEATVLPPQLDHRSSRDGSGTV